MAAFAPVAEVAPLPIADINRFIFFRRSWTEIELEKFDLQVTNLDLHR